MILTTVILSACQQEKVAAMDDHSTQFFGRQGVQLISAQTPATIYTAPSYQAVPRDAVATNDLPPPIVKNTPAPYVPQKITATPAPRPMTVAALMHWAWPVEGQVIEHFGSQGNGVANEGITIAARKGTPIHAAAPGEVVFVGSQLKDYGNMTIVRHADGEMSAYSHASEIIVAKGDRVKQGDVLGYVGQSGNAPQPELHFAVRSDNRPVDPMTKLPAQMASN